MERVKRFIRQARGCQSEIQEYPAKENGNVGQHYKVFTDQQ